MAGWQNQGSRREAQRILRVTSWTQRKVWAANLHLFQRHQGKRCFFLQLLSKTVCVLTFSQTKVQKWYAISSWRPQKSLFTWNSRYLFYFSDALVVRECPRSQIGPGQRSADDGKRRHVADLEPNRTKVLQYRRKMSADRYYYLRRSYPTPAC